MESSSICKALKYTDRNFLEQPDFDHVTLINNNIFPYRRVPGVIEDRNSFLTISFGSIRSAGGIYFNSFSLTITVFCHKNIFDTDYGQTRVDFCLSEIDKILNQEHGFGLGKLEFVDSDEIVFNENYMGSYIIYRPVDFSTRK